MGKLNDYEPKGVFTELIHYLIRFRKGLLSRFKRPEECRTLVDLVGTDEDVHPSQYNPAIIDWVPTTKDILRMVGVLRYVAEVCGLDSLHVTDIAGKNGFLAKLLINECRKQGLDINVDVVDPDRIVTWQARRSYEDELDLRFYTETAAKYTRRGIRPDVVICSWMLPTMNLTPDIRSLDPEVVIYVKDTAGDVGEDGSFDEGDGYFNVVRWYGIDGFHAREYMREREFYDKYPEYQEDLVGNEVLIQATEYVIRRTDGALRAYLQQVDKSGKTYQWEDELPQYISDLMFLR